MILKMFFGCINVFWFLCFLFYFSVLFFSFFLLAFRFFARDLQIWIFLGSAVFLLASLFSVLSFPFWFCYFILISRSIELFVWDLQYILLFGSPWPLRWFDTNNLCGNGPQFLSCGNGPACLPTLLVMQWSYPLAHTICYVWQWPTIW